MRDPAASAPSWELQSLGGRLYDGFGKGSPTSPVSVPHHGKVSVSTDSFTLPETRPVVLVAG